LRINVLILWPLRGRVKEERVEETHVVKHHVLFSWEVRPKQFVSLVSRGAFPSSVFILPMGREQGHISPRLWFLMRLAGSTISLSGRREMISTCESVVCVKRTRADATFLGTSPPGSQVAVREAPSKT